MPPNRDASKYKIARLNRQLKKEDLTPHLEEAAKTKKPLVLHSLQNIADSIKGTEMEGLPFKIALMRSSLMPPTRIAKELDIPYSAVKQFMMTPGFNHVISLIASSVHQECIMDAHLVIQHHLLEKQDKELAKWYLEVTGEVASSRPMNIQQHKTINVMPGMPQMPGQPVQQLPTNSSAPQGINPASLAQALFERMNSNIMESDGGKGKGDPPPINISQ